MCGDTYTVRGFFRRAIYLFFKPGNKAEITRHGRRIRNNDPVGKTRARRVSLDPTVAENFW